MLFYDKNHPAHYDTRDIRSTPKNYQHERVPFAVRTTYHNGLSIPVTVVHRNGIAVTYPPATDTSVRTFTVKIRYGFTKAVKIDAHHLLNEIEESDHHEVQAWKNAYETREHHPYSQEHEMCVAYSYTRQELEQWGGSLYMPDVDLVISIRDASRTPRHPYSRNGISRSLAEGNDEVNNLTLFSKTIKIIDNNGSHGDRFVNVNGFVFRITATTSDDMRDGIYHITSASVTGDHPPGPPQVTWYNYADGDKALCLYRTYDEALHCGDVLAARDYAAKEQAIRAKELEANIKTARLDKEAAIDKRKNEFELSKLDLDIQAHKKAIEVKEKEDVLERSKLEVETERKTLEHTRAMETLVRKDEFDRRSSRRKEILEYLKVIPAVLAGIGLLAAAFKKAMT